MMPDASRIKITAPELKRQREAALRDEDYDVEWEDMRRFRKEIKPQLAPPVVKEYPCDKCGRKFDSALGLQNHSKWHAENVRPIEGSAHMCGRCDAAGLTPVTRIRCAMRVERCETIEV